MAKKDKDTIYQEFLADLKALNPEIEKVLDEKVTSKLKESVLARADYSASMDALKKEREDLQTYLAAEKQKIDGWQTWYGNATTEFAQMAKEVQAYRDEFGELNTADKRRAAAQAGLTPEQFEQKLNEELQRRETAYMKFMDDLSDLKMEHRERFKERLDTSAVYKIAGEKSLPLDVAYDIYIADRVEADRKTAYEADMKKAREEGAREALAKHNLPVVPSTSDIRVHTLDAKDVPTTSRERVSAAVSAFLGGNKS